jgi:hypothetical protein
MIYPLDLTDYLDQLIYFDKVIRRDSHDFIGISRRQPQDMNYIKKEKIPMIIDELKIDDLFSQKIYTLFQLESLIKIHLKSILSENINKQSLTKLLLMKMLKIEDIFVEGNIKQKPLECNKFYFPILYLLLAVFDFKDFKNLRSLFTSNFYKKDNMYFMDSLYSYKQRYSLSQINDEDLKNLKNLTTANYESFFKK